MPHIDTWTNETAQNGKNDTAIGGENKLFEKLLKVINVKSCVKIFVIVRLRLYVC